MKSISKKGGKTQQTYSILSLNSMTATLWLFVIAFVHIFLAFRFFVHTLCWTFQWRKCAKQINWKYLLESPSKLRVVRPSRWAITWAKRKPKPVENIVVTSHKFHKDQRVYYTMFGEMKCKRWIAVCRRKRSHKEWDRFCEWHAFWKRFILPDGTIYRKQFNKKREKSNSDNICVSHLIWSAANKNQPYQNQAVHVYCWSEIRNSKGHSHCMTTK